MTLVLATDDTGGPEIFASVQGEGPSAGEPTAFMRLSRCNLACVWCDTAYTWHFDGDERPHRSGETFDRKANQVTLEVEDVADRILALGQRRLVVTGGEPMLQAPALAQLLALLPEGHGYVPYLAFGADTYLGQNVGLLTRVDPELALSASSRRPPRSATAAPEEGAGGGGGGEGDWYATL